MHILILGHGREMPGIIRELDPDVRLTVMCEVSALPRIRDLAPLDRVVAARSGSECGEWVSLARGVHEARPIDHVVGFGEWLQGIAAAIGVALGVVAHAPSTIEHVYDKSRMRHMLASAGVEEVRSAVVTNAEGVEAAAASVGMPCIVKPVDGVGSRGVTLLTDVARGHEAYRLAASDADEDRDVPVIVEEYLEGTQYSVEMLARKGQQHAVAVTRKYSDPSTFVELGHVVPAPLSEGRRAALIEHCVRAVTALGVATGATHTEVVWTNGGPRVIETHVRLGGDDIPRLVEDTTGVRLEEEVARIVLGLPPGRAHEAAAPASAIWFVPAAASGELIELVGVEEAERSEGVIAVHRLATPGAVLAGLGSSGDRVVSVRARGETPEEALARARAAAALIRVVVSTAAPVTALV